MVLTEKEHSRYNRHILLKEIGCSGQEKLQSAKVLVIGAGGLGCPVLQYLTAAGVGSIGIVDFDAVEESNLQRQVLFDTTSLGRNKAIVAQEKLKENNPLISIEAYPIILNQSNAIRLFNKYDIVVDCTDNYESRYLINDASIITKKPVVYASIYKYEGQLSVFNYNNGPSYRCLFPKPPEQNNNCSQVGVLGVLAGIVGNLQANEVLKLILGIGQLLSGKMMIINSLTNQNQIISVEKVELKTLTAAGFETHNYSIQCGVVNEISPNELQERLNSGEKIQTIDVRTSQELPKILDLEQYQTTLSNLENNTITVLYCQSGIRSRQVILNIKKTTDESKLFNLKGGVNEWLKTFPNTKT